MKNKRKIIYFHGFLGGPEDMSPLFLNDCDSTAYDLRKNLFKPNYIQEIAREIESCDLAVGYSYGGRVLEELFYEVPNKFKKLIFISSRHTMYSDVQLKERALFKESLLNDLLESREKFENVWKEFKLFSGHSMAEYRIDNDIKISKWSDEEIKQYLNTYFNSAQREPQLGHHATYIYGSKDSKYKEEALKLNCDTVEVKEAGHRVLFEKPEEVKAIIKRVLSDH